MSITIIPRRRLVSIHFVSSGSKIPVVAIEMLPLSGTTTCIESPQHVLVLTANSLPKTIVKYVGIAKSGDNVNFSRKAAFDWLS